MNISVGDHIVMKKPHPCGSKEFTVTRIGADFKIKCVVCGREMMLPRSKVEKNIKEIRFNSSYFGINRGNSIFFARCGCMDSVRNYCGFRNCERYFLLS